jgi:phage gp36-like protein
MPRTPYATIDQLINPALGLPIAAVKGMSSSDLEEGLIAATDLADSYLSNRFKLPITAWRKDLSQAVAAIAAYQLLAGRGFNPQPGSPDEQVRLRYEDAIRWLKDCSKGLATPAGIVDSTPAIDAGLVETEAPVFVTRKKRGWGL